MMSSAILVLIDGAKADVFEELLADNKLPHIKDHITSRGAYARMTTVFTSTTGPAYAPFLTGCFTGTINLPGIRWFDKRAYAEKPFWNCHRYRSYCGWESIFINADLDPNFPTIFELTKNPINVFGPISRGVPIGNNRGALAKARKIAMAHRNGLYAAVDDSAEKHILLALDTPSEFYFLALSGVDGMTHNNSPRHPSVIAAYGKADRVVGKVADKLKKLNRYESTVLAFCSDHGLSETHTHFDVPDFVENVLGLSTLYYPPMFRWKPEASVQVSGNGMAHLYFKNGDWKKICYYEDVKEYIEPLLKQEAVDIILSRDRENWIRVDSARGSARIRELDGKIEYRLISNDPFGFDGLPNQMSFDDALHRTFDTSYPDAPVQIVQNFRSERCGDIVLSARLGFDLRKRWEYPEHKSSHGSLHREHMMTPFGISVPVKTGPLRSADVFPSLLTLLGKTTPVGIDGRSFISTAN